MQVCFLIEFEHKPPERDTVVLDSAELVLIVWVERDAVVVDFGSLDVPTDKQGAGLYVPELDLPLHQGRHRDYLGSVGGNSQMQDGKDGFRVRDHRYWACLMCVETVELQVHAVVIAHSSHHLLSGGADSIGI
jgi:hypothetical protein